MSEYPPPLPEDHTRLEPVRVLLLIDTLVSGGKERQLVELVKGISARKDVTAILVILSDKIEYQEVADLNVPVHKLIRRVDQDVRVLGQLLSIARRFKPHVIHSWELMCSVYAIPVKLLVRAKLINGTIRNAPEKIPPFRKLWVRHHLTSLFSDVMLGNSLAGLRAYRIPSHKGHCIYNGFDLSRLRNVPPTDEVRRQLGITTKYVVGMVGNFSDKKDQPTLIEAAHMVLAQNRDVTFILIGGGENLDQCRELARGDVNIRFPGRRQDVESIVNVFDIGVLATFTEGISNSVMEYMALAKPVIASGGGGTDELVIDGKTGCLVPQRDPVALADRITHLLAHPEERALMGRLGRDRIESEFGLETMTDRFISLYRQCMAL